MQSDSVSTLRNQLHGQVLLPGDAEFDAASSIWNARLQQRPAAVARCAGATDVAASVRFARQNALPVIVRGRGHSYGGRSAAEQAFVVDLSLMDGVQVDAAARRATVSGGATWAGLDAAALACGLATTGATVSTVGVAGAALGGGSGFLVRKFGMSLDNVLAAEVVTADGRIMHTSADEHPDLFWGLRGAGANLGIVTSLYLRLHPIPHEVLAGELIHVGPDVKQGLRHYRAFMAAAPDDVQCYAFLLRIPPIEAFPSEHHGQIALDLVVCHAGEASAAERTLQPLLAFGRPIMNTVAPMPYTTLQKSFDLGLPGGQRYYSRAHYLRDLSDDAIDAVVDRAGGLPGAYSLMYFEALGGAVAQVSSDATAFPHRDAPFAFHVLAGWSEPEEDAAAIAWAQDVHEAMAEHATGGVYVNLLAEDEGSRVAAAYGPNFDRLRSVKRAWDPENVFQGNVNVLPGP